MGLKVCMISGSYPPMKDGVGDYTQRLFSVLKRKFEEPNIFLITTKTVSWKKQSPGYLVSLKNGGSEHYLISLDS